MLNLQEMKTTIISHTTTNTFTLEATAFGHDKATGQCFIQIRFNGTDLNLNFDYKGRESGVELVDSKELLAKLYECGSISYYLDENGMIRADFKGDIADLNQKRYMDINATFERLNMTRITPSDMEQISEYLTLIDGYCSNL